MANTHALELRRRRLTVGLLLAGVALLARVLLLRRVALRGRRALVGLLLLAVLRASCREGRRGVAEKLARRALSSQMQSHNTRTK